MNQVEIAGSNVKLSVPEGTLWLGPYLCLDPAAFLSKLFSASLGYYSWLLHVTFERHAGEFQIYNRELPRFHHQSNNSITYLKPLIC